MPKKTAKPLDELDKKTNPNIVKQAKENAKREIALDKQRRALFESSQDKK